MGWICALENRLLLSAGCAGGALKTRPGFTVQFNEPPACWCSLRGKTSSDDADACRSPQPRFRQLRVITTAHRHRIRIPPEPVLGTAFHSPVTALSLPLRGQRSRPAPSQPRRITPRIRSISSSFAPLRFRGRCRASSSPDTRYPRSFPALSRSRRPPLPFGPLQPSGSKRSAVPTARSSPCRTPDNPSGLAGVPLGKSFRKPWNWIDNDGNNVFRQSKTGPFSWAFLSFLGITFQ